MTAPGQRLTEAARKRLDQFKFYVDCLTLPQQSTLASRYIRKVPPRYRSFLLRHMTIAELALCEVFSRETYGW
jgi:hypothetical protein